LATPKQLAKNAEKCAIDSFGKAEDDPTTNGQISRAVQPQQKWWALVVRNCIKD
jgi:hypothetical protein